MADVTQSPAPARRVGMHGIYHSNIAKTEHKDSALSPYIKKLIVEQGKEDMKNYKPTRAFTRLEDNFVSRDYKTITTERQERRMVWWSTEMKGSRVIGIRQ